MSIWNVEELVRITCGAAAESKPGMETKAVRVAKAIADADLGCKTEGVRKLLSVVLDMEIPGVEVASKFRKGTVVVPVVRGGSHNYELGTPVVWLNDKTPAQMGDVSHGVAADGCVGNWLAVEQCRLATEAEIRAAFGG